MRPLSYQYVTSCIAFRAGLQRSLKKELFFFLFFFFFNVQWPIFSTYLGLAAPLLGCLGPYKDFWSLVVNGLEAFTSSAIPVTTLWASFELT